MQGTGQEALILVDLKVLYLKFGELELQLKQTNKITPIENMKLKNYGKLEKQTREQTTPTTKEPPNQNHQLQQNHQPQEATTARDSTQLEPHPVTAAVVIITTSHQVAAEAFPKPD